MYRLLALFTLPIGVVGVLVHNNLLGFLICMLATFFFFSFWNKRFSGDDFLQFIKKNKIFSVIYLFFIVFVVFVLHLFRVSSNVEYIFKNSGRLMLETSRGYEEIEQTKNDVIFNEYYQNDRVKISSISIRRTNESLIHRIENFLNPNKILIFEFNLKNEFSLSADVKNNLRPITSSEAIKNKNFSLNTNFYGEGAIGGVIIDGVQFKGENASSKGFFKVINGKPVAGPKSIFEEVKGSVSHSCQAHPSVMKNGVLFHYILSEELPYKKVWKKKTYRNLIGNLSNGNLVAVLSNNGGLVSVKEISQIAQKYGVINASLFDGGGALQYEYDNDDFSVSFSAMNNQFDFGQRIDRFFLSRAHIRFPAKSPVFMTVKHID
jgi:hypothetical protein